MIARLRKFLDALGSSFWVVPGAMVLGGVLLALALVHVDRSNPLPAWLVQTEVLYNGGGTGARTLLGAIASSAKQLPNGVWHSEGRLALVVPNMSYASLEHARRVLDDARREVNNADDLADVERRFGTLQMSMKQARATT